jgi:putative oxidoreductase
MTDIALLVARIALSAVFLISGWGKLTGDLAGFSASLAAKGAPAATLLGPLAAGIETCAAALLIAGLFARPAAALLVAFTAAATALSHLFWTFPEAAQASQAIPFWKNVGLAGGLLAIAAVGPGRLALDRLRPRRTLPATPLAGVAR